MRTVEVPSRSAPEAYDFARLVGRKLEEKGYDVSTDSIMALLEVVSDLADGPRYVAEMTPVHDSAGNHSYVVTDRRTGRIEETFEGYFARHDAHITARIKNGLADDAPDEMAL
jgi:hypothetical protein